MIGKAQLGEREGEEDRLTGEGGGSRIGERERGYVDHGARVTDRQRERDSEKETERERVSERE